MVVFPAKCRGVICRAPNIAICKYLGGYMLAGTVSDAINRAPTSIAMHRLNLLSN